MPTRPIAIPFGVACIFEENPMLPLHPLTRFAIKLSIYLQAAIPGKRHFAAPD